MRKIIGLTFALIILISLVGALAYIVPVRGIVTGAIVEVTPTTVSPGAPFNATLDTSKISGQWVDFYLSDNGYAKIDPEKDIPLAKEVPVDRTVVKWNVTFIVPDNIASGTWYLKATDDGGASVAVSAPISISVPPKVTIVSWDDGDNIIKKGEKFNITIVSKSTTGLPTVIHLNFFLLRGKVYKWINSTDVIWNKTHNIIYGNVTYLEVYNTTVRTGTTADGYYYVSFNATLKDFAPEFFDDSEDLGFYYVIAYIDGAAAGTTIKIKPSVEVSPTSANVEGTLTISGHHFPYKTTVLESTWQAIGKDIYLYLVKLIPPAGASRLIKVWKWIGANETVAPDGTFLITGFTVPPLQGGGKDVTVEVFAFPETTEPAEGDELLKVSSAFTLVPDVKAVYEVDNDGSWKAVGKLSPGDWVKVVAKGLITAETLKVFLYNTTAGARKKIADLTVVASDIENDGNATIVVQLPPTISYEGVTTIKLFINGTTDSNYAATADISIPDDTPDPKVFINPVVKLDKVEFDIAKDNEVGVASFKIVLIGIMNPTTPSKYAEVANVTLYGKDTGYEYVFGLKELTYGYCDFTFVLPEVPYDIDGYEARVNSTYASSYAVIPVNATLKVEPSFVYSTTAEVTVTGKGFEAGKTLTIYWDGVLPWITVTTSEKGTFTATEKIPGAAPGLHVVTADAPTGQVRKPTAYVTIQTPPVKAFTVSVKVGQVYMTGETAEIHILTTFDGKPVEPAELKAELWFNSDPELLASLGFGTWNVPVKLDIPSEYITKVDDGWYVIKLPLVINKDTRMPWLGVPGVYTVKVVAAYAFGEEYKLYDAQLATFTISPMLEASVLAVFSLGAGQQAILAQLSSLTEVVMKIDAATAEIKDLVVSKSGEILAELKAFKGEVTLKLSGLPEEMVKLLEPKIKSIVETASGDLKAVIETKFGTVTKSLSDLGAKIDKVEGTVVTISTALGTVKTDLASLIKDVKTDLASGQVEIKTALGDIKGKVDDISGTVATIKTDVGTLKVELPSKVASALKATLDEIKSGISDVKSSVDTVKGSVDTAKSDIAKKVEDTAKTVADKVGEISGTLTAYGVIIIILVIITLALTAFTGLKKKP